MAIFNIKDPTTGRTARVEANNPEEAASLAKAEWTKAAPTKASSLVDKLADASRRAKAEGERMGGSDLKASAANVADPLLSLLQNTSMATKALHDARNEMVDWMAPKAKEAKELVENIPDVYIPVPELKMPTSSNPLPLSLGMTNIKPAVTTPIKASIHMGEALLDPYNLALTYAAPAVLKSTYGIGDDVIQAVRNTPQYKEFVAWAANKIPEAIKTKTGTLRAYVLNELPQLYKEAKSSLGYKQVESIKKNLTDLSSIENATPEQAKEITYMLEGKLRAPRLENQPRHMLAPKMEEKGLINPPTLDELEAQLLQKELPNTIGAVGNAPAGAKAIAEAPEIVPVFHGTKQAAADKIAREGKLASELRMGAGADINAPSKGFAGQGTYTTASEGTAESYARQVDPTSPAVIKGYIPKAKIKDISTDEQLKEELLKIANARRVKNKDAWVENALKEVKWQQSPDVSSKLSEAINKRAIKEGYSTIQYPGKELITPKGKDIRLTEIPTKQAEQIELFEGTLPPAKATAIEVPVPKALTKEQISTTKKLRDSLDSLGKEAVSLGLLSEKTYLKNLKTYNPREYKRYAEELDIADIFGKNKPNRIQTDRFKKRTVTDPDSLDRLYGAFPTEKGIAQLSAAIEKAKFFKFIADNPAWASNEAKPGWVQLSKIAGLGPLKGKFVEPKIAADLNSTFKSAGEFENAIRKIVSTWKLGKSAYNPAVQINNAMFNTVLADWSGADFAAQARLLPGVVKDIVGKKGIYTEMQKAGVTDITELQQDVVKKLNELIGKKSGSLYDSIASLMETPQEMYQVAELINKGIIAKAAMERGMNVQQAMAHAKKWGMDYNDVSPLVRDARQSLIPFLTFPTKLAPLAAETLATDPMKIYKYKLFLDAIEKVSIENGTVTADDVRRIHSEDKGTPVVLPIKNKDGNPYVWNLRRVLPIDNVTGVFHIGGPISIAAQAALNVKGYSQGEPIPIRERHMTNREKATATTDFLGKALLPGLTAGIPDVRSPFRGGTSFERIASAAKGDIDPKTGKEKSVTNAILSAIGLDIADDVSQLTEANRLKLVKKIMNEKKSALNRTAKYKNISDAELEYLLTQFEKKLEELLEEPVSFREGFDALRNDLEANPGFQMEE